MSGWKPFRSIGTTGSPPARTGGARARAGIAERAAARSSVEPSPAHRFPLRPPTTGARDTARSPSPNPFLSKPPSDSTGSTASPSSRCCSARPSCSNTASITIGSDPASAWRWASRPAIISLLAGDRVWRRGQTVFAQGVIGLGLALLYLSIYAAAMLYQLAAAESRICRDGRRHRRRGRARCAL